MSHSIRLQTLADHREALLLAEVAALLHDVGKLTDTHIKHVSDQNQWANDDGYKVVVDNPQQVVRLSQVAANVRKPDILNNVLNARSPKAADFLPTALKQSLETLRVSVLNQDYSLAELIMLGMPGFATHQSRSQLLAGKDGWLPALLGVCHNVAHVDKEDPIGGVQPSCNVLTSNAFGYEQQIFVLGDPQKSLDVRLSTLAIDSSNLAMTRKKILDTLEYGLGDTRRPTNEVSLADWSAMVAALFKTAIAGAVLTGTQPGIRGWLNWREKVIAHDFRWHLLRVNFDVLGLYAKAIKIADLVGYQRAVDEACEAVKKLVEEEYPLGNEIYRDTTGIYFTFPDLDLPAELAQEIRRRVEAIEPELAPRIAVTVGDGGTATEQLKGILAKARREALEALAQPFDSQNLSTCWQQQWEMVGEGKWEVCPVCRLRPKEESAEVCKHCEKRRQSRTEIWQKDLTKTIWVGEIADYNQRLALLVGRFGLDHWLSGDLVQTMLVKADPASNTFTPKNPSPARLRRIWETCQRFWLDTVVGDILLNKISSASLRRERYLIIPTDNQNWQSGPAYNAKIGDKPIDLFWNGQAFLTISNLEWLLSEEERQGDRRAALEKTLQPGTNITLDDPDNRQRKHTVTIKRAEPVTGKFAEYQPWLPLLTTPDQFLALVPAADALKIADQIRQQYEEQFGKARNRLPFSLGLVFFDRKMPLMAVLDAGRQMLTQTIDERPWTVEAKNDHDGHDPLPEGKPRRCVRLELARDGRRIHLKIPTVMGDGKTFDAWYPYWRVEGKPTDRNYWFIGPDGEHWVHVSDLRPGDTVYFTPSTFDFEYLDSASRRFAISYEANGRRFGRPTRPYYLEDLERLEGLWQTFCKLSPTQVKQVLQTIEITRERWFGRDETHRSASDPVFRRFVENTLANAEWDWKTIENSEQLITAAVRGELADLAELHLEILKEERKEQPYER
jgi:hypothetical protein